MKRIIAVFLTVILFCTFIPENRTYSESNKELDKIDFKDLTPKEVFKKANEDMKNLYGLDNYYPTSTKKGSLNVELIQEQINEAIQKPEEFKGFDIVYGTSHGTLITYNGKQMHRYSGYNRDGDDVSTRGFPWDAGWSGRKINDLPMINNPWAKGKVVEGDFDLFPKNFNDQQLPDKLWEYIPCRNFEEQIITALNAEYAKITYSKFMYENKNSEYANWKVYEEGKAPQVDG
ncbi:hypothetical protein RE628_06325 [Paenibacillus sp. D2_2]|uniref:hypothetical protein n=1 Tax=Paenibacillus sp. D2_2 TaxID=3073092 RepID=UPI00281696D2|nr:hypothetical protein [Paenibacillus sp. D2_2]WMT42049.1 hypothetical protein RE628_06325 [Paenibacillus sp. D2_2]